MPAPKSTQPGAEDLDPTKSTPPQDQGPGGEGQQDDAQNDNAEGNDAPDESKWDEGTKKYIQSLRKESAKYRQKSKESAPAIERLTKLEQGLKAALGIGDDEEVSTEDKLEQITAQAQQTDFKAAILEAALEHGIPKSELRYFQFLVNETLGELGEDEELGDDRMAEIVAQVQARSNPGRASGNTSVDPKGEPNPKGGGNVTVDQFVKMGLTEKSNLYAKNPNLYTSLMAEARSKRLL